MDCYRTRRPQMKDRSLIPAQTADWTDEHKFCPKPAVEKDIDVLVVSRLATFKNLPLLAQALLALRRTRPERRFRVAWAIGKPLEAAARDRYGAARLAEMEQVLGRIEDYIEPLGRVVDMASLYPRAKTLFLASRIEGKPRALAEAMCANVPVVTLAELNLAARGDVPLFGAACGLATPSDPDAIADGLARAVDGFADFDARNAYLAAGGGRMNFVWDCLERLPYYRSRIPGDSRAARQSWLDEALRSNYGMTLFDFLHFSHRDHALARRHGLQGLGRADGAEASRRLLQMYSDR
jgi:glycosyltransferase involved in cell wall biosynthesis